MASINKTELRGLATLFIFVAFFIALFLLAVYSFGQSVNKKIPLSPMQFGAKGSSETLTQLGYKATTNDSIFGKGVWVASKTVDWNAVNAMFRYMEKNNMHHCIMIAPKGILYVNDSISLPNSNKYQLCWWVLDGAGCEFKFNSTGFYTDVTSLEQATNEATSNSYDIQHFILTGSNKGTAIRLQAPYTNNISFNKISNFDYGIRFLFCLNSVAIGNMCWSINIYEIEFGTLEGFVAGANDNNSQSNNSEIAHHRSYGNGKMTTSLFVKNSSTIVDRQHIGEGGGGDHLIKIDGKYSNFLKSIDVDILHVEQTYKKSVIFIEAKDGKYNINEIYNQYPNTLIDSKSSGYITINVNQTLWTHDATKFGFANDGTAYNFTDNCFSSCNNSVKQSKYWLQDATHVVPQFAPVFQYNSNPVWFEQTHHNKGNSIKVFETLGKYQ
jgi:hypothetical protein